MNKQHNQAGADRGLIFLVQGYSVSDGPGFRTTVFFKGCPLRCKWCQNPESWNSFPELMTHDDLCLGCGKCVDICPERAITIEPGTGRRIIEREQCSRCFKCVAACPALALTSVGEYMSIDRVMAEIVKDELFMVRSGGGVTVSGGEPLLQGPFVANLLKACRDRGLHTALDTCGHTPWPVLERALDYTDLVLYDLKHMDPAAHLQATGVDNALALANLRRIPEHIKVWFRIPLVPGYNDTLENLEKLLFLSREITPEKISILPFHRYSDGKYLNLGLETPCPEINTYKKERLEEIRVYLEKSGLPVTMGE